MIASGDWAGMATVSFFAAMLLATSGFGFAVMAVPFFLMFAPAGQAIQIIIILTVAVTLVVALRLRQALDPPLLVRLSVGSVIGLPFGLAAFRFADPLIVRAVAGATVVAFAVMLARSRLGRHPTRLRMAPRWDLATGALAGAANALVGISGPPVLIYLMLGGAPIRSVRATLVAFFALCRDAGGRRDLPRRVAQRLADRCEPVASDRRGQPDRPGDRQPARRNCRRGAGDRRARGRRALHPRSRRAIADR